MTKQLNLIEWELQGNVKISTDSHYSVFEDKSYALLNVSLAVQRRPSYYRNKIMGLLTILVMMSWAVFFLGAANLNDRLSVLFTLFLASVAFHFVVLQSIPKTSYETLMDRFISTTYAFIFLPTLESVIVSIIQNTNPNTAAVIDWITLVGLAISYFVCLTIFLLIGKYAKIRKAVTGEEKAKMDTDIDTSLSLSK